MIGRLNHVAIAVPDLEAAARQYRDVLGGRVSPVEDQPEHGVRTVFVELPNTKVELLGVLGEGSPIAGFLERNPSGGIHHLCYEVEDLSATRDRLTRAGARILGDGDPRIGALVRVVRSAEYRRLLADLPGYDARRAGETRTIR